MRAYKLHRPPLGRNPNHNTVASKLRRQLRRRDPNHNQKKEGGSLSSHPNTATSLANNGRTHSIGGAALAWRTGPRSAHKRPIEGRAQQRTSAEQSIRPHAPCPRRSRTDQGGRKHDPGSAAWKLQSSHVQGVRARRSAQAPPSCGWRCRRGRVGPP